MHGDGVPNAVLAEEGDGVVFFEAVVFYEGRGEVGGGLFDLQPGEAFFGYGVGVACEFVGWEAVDGGVGWVFEEPLPGCEVAGDYEAILLS